MKGTKEIHLRIPQTLSDRITIQANKESRSINSELIELIRRGLESQITKQLVTFDD